MLNDGKERSGVDGGKRSFSHINERNHEAERRIFCLAYFISRPHHRKAVLHGLGFIVIPSPDNVSFGMTQSESIPSVEVLRTVLAPKAPYRVIFSSPNVQG